MDNHEHQNADETILVSAVHQEVFSRIFPHIRHDLLGYISTSLIRVSIMERYLNRDDISRSQLVEELNKIKSHLREAIFGIKDLQFWDFDFPHEDVPSNILKKSIQLMGAQLATKSIQIQFIAIENLDEEKVATKPLLYCLLCVLGFIEDNNYANSLLNIDFCDKAISILISHHESEHPTIYKRNRNLKVNQTLASTFAQSQNMRIIFNKNKILINW